MITEIVISDDSYIFDAVTDNDTASSGLVLVQNDWESLFKDPRKIDLLIISKIIEPELIPAHKIRAIINFSTNCIAKHEIQLSMPVKLSLLIETITKLRQDRESLFCYLYDNWIYNEKYSCIASPSEVIKLTEKENAVFRALMLSKDYKIDKNYLRIKVWNYHKNSESTTVDTHLYKLRQKLPKGMMNIKDDSCFLAF